MARTSKFTDEQRLEIALEMLSGKMSVAEVCRKWGIGSSSKNIKQTVSFKLPEEIIVEKLNKALSPQIEINELKK